MTHQQYAKLQVGDMLRCVDDGNLEYAIITAVDEDFIDYSDDLVKVIKVAWIPSIYFPIFEFNQTNFKEDLLMSYIKVA